MIQPIRKRVAEANGIDTTKYVYTLLLDMNNIMKIASVDHKMNNDGKEYGIILSSLRMIGNVLNKKDFNYCIAAYDGVGSGVLRWKIYKPYKANRDKHYERHDPSLSPKEKELYAYEEYVLSKSRKNAKKESDEDSFKRQKEVLQKILQELCIRQFEFENVEGDDVISNYIKNKKRNEKVVVVSSDRDLTQLISDTVIVYNPRHKEFITMDNARDKLGIPSENIVLEKILCGDASDNIKGIKGIGEKTLYELFPEIREKKLNLEAIIERSSELLDRRKAEKKKPLKSLENVLNAITDGEQGKEIYEINRKLIDLSEPLLTEEARVGMDEEAYAPLPTDELSIGNVYRIARDNNVNDILDESKFGDLLSPFSRIMMNERKRYEEYKKSC